MGSLEARALLGLRGGVCCRQDGRAPHLPLESAFRTDTAAAPAILRHPERSSLCSYFNLSKLGIPPVAVIGAGPWHWSGRPAHIPPSMVGVQLLATSGWQGSLHLCISFMSPSVEL